MKIPHWFMKYIKPIAIFMYILLLLDGCAARQNNLLYSTLWVQSAAEYKANCLQTYNMAAKNIDSALQDKGWTAAVEQRGHFSSLPPAVVMDIDETVLDNSPYQARLIIEGTGFDPRTWDEWIALKRAPAVPGAVSFIKHLKGKNVEVFFITNRECAPRAGTNCPCPQEQETIDNLAGVGIDGVKPEHVLMQNERPGWGSEKKKRREAIADGHRILMLVGDDLGDFLPDVKKNITLLQRDELVRQYERCWGRTWYMLSNPVYGKKIVTATIFIYTVPPTNTKPRLCVRNGALGVSVHSFLFCQKKQTRL
jgi:acid phosphatase